MTGGTRHSSGTKSRRKTTPTKCADAEAADVLMRARTAAERAQVQLDKAQEARVARAEAEAKADADFRAAFAKAQARDAERSSP